MLSYISFSSSHVFASPKISSAPSIKAPYVGFLGHDGFCAPDASLSTGVAAANPFPSPERVAEWSSLYSGNVSRWNFNIAEPSPRR